MKSSRSPQRHLSRNLQAMTRRLSLEQLERRTLLSSGGTGCWGVMMYDHLIINPATGVAASAPAASGTNLNASSPSAASSPAGSLPAGSSPAGSSAQGLSPYATASPSGLTPVQIRTAYGVSTATLGSLVGDGTGQTIAIVDAYDYPGA